MLICSYRDNEVNDSHPFAAAVKQIPEEFITRLHLKPLGSEVIADMVADIVTSNRDEIEPLAALIHNKTGGNPFFAGEFLKTLNSEKLLAFDVQDYKWHWDLEHIREKGFTDNVVDLVIGNIGKFQQETQLLLKYSSMLGNIFDLEKLSILREESREDVFKGLNEAIHEGFVIPLNEKTFTFSHDRIQQGAYNMTPEDDRSFEHLRAGRLLLSAISEDKLDDNLFVILDQFNKGSRLITSDEEKIKIAELNYKAGRKAKESAAFFPAYQFFKAGIDLLDENSWKNRYDFTLTIYNNAAEAAYLSADHDGMEALGRIILKNIRTPIDKTPFYLTKIKAATSQGKMMEALDIGLNFLDELGVHIPHNPSKAYILINSFETRLALKGITPEDIAGFPDTNDPRLQAILSIMENIYASAHFCSPKTLAIIVYKVIRFLVKEKVSYSVSRIFFMLYGAFFGGYKYLRVPELLANRPDAKESEVIVLFLNAYSVLHWKEHLRETFPLLMRTYAVGLECGNFVYVGFAVLNRFRHMFIAGVEFSEMEKDFDAYVPVLFRLKQDRSAIGCQLFRQAVLNLMGFSDDPCIISGNVYREEEKIPYHEQGKDFTILFTLYFLKMFLCYLFGRNAEAMKNSKTAEICMGTLNIQANSGSYYFYDSLVHLANIDQLSDKERRQALEKVDGNQRKLQKWAHNTPMNYKHKHLLVEAELSRFKGEISDAMEYYDQAIKLAGKNKYLQEEAIANELAGRFYLSQEKEKIASVYLTDARYLYQRWGAVVKVKDMDKKYPWLSTKANASSKEDTVGTTSTSTENGLDTTSILKASRALSGEIILDKLISQLMRITMENAGAQRGFLILNDNGHLSIEVEGSLESVDTPTLKSIVIDNEKCRLEKALAVPTIPPAMDSQSRVAARGWPCGNDKLLSSSMVHYVERTKETVVLGDACKEGQFTNDDYVKTEKLRSVLCMPIMNQSVMTGILYLENKITIGAFTPERVKVLEVLASQAAVSIENARLYLQLGESEKKYRLVAENVTDGIWVADFKSLRFTFLSPSVGHIFGYSPEETQNMSLLDFVHEEDREAVSQAIAEETKIIKNGRENTAESRTLQLKLKRKDGSRFWVEVNWRILTDERNEPTALLGVTRDITERKKVEQEIVKLNEELEQRVKDRTAELIEAKEHAEVANKTKSTFLANMSHELRTPLNGILGYAQILKRDGALSQLQVDELTIIEKSGNYLLTLINDILDISRIEANRMELHPTDFTLSAFLQSIVGIISVRAEEKGLDFYYEPVLPLPLAIKADETRLRQVLINFLGNAVKFTEQGAVTFKVAAFIEQQTADRGQEETATLRFEVTDTGEGIAPDQLERIFLPFEQINADKFRTGTGLGLAISKTLVEAMGGVIQVRSIPGEGSTFIFEADLAGDFGGCTGRIGLGRNALLVIRVNAVRYWWWMTGMTTGWC